MMQFDTFALLIGFPVGAALVFLTLRAAKRQKPYLPYSHLAFFSNRPGRKISLASSPHRLLFLAGLLLLSAFFDPALVEKSQAASPPSTEGRALYLVLDQSSSMNTQAAPALPKKIDLLKDVTEEFITGRPQDLTGLVAFARAAHVLSPLTLDHEQLLLQLKQLDVVKNREDDGTAIGYAVYKTASVLAATRHFGERERKKGNPAFNIEGAAIILVTDGFQFPHPGDQGKRLRTIGVEEAADYAKQHRVRLYIINIDPQILSDEVAPQRRLMQRAAEMTGGQFFAAPDAEALNQIFASLDELEVSTVPLPAKQVETRLFSFSPLLIMAALAIMALSILCETLYIRRVP